MKHNYLFKQLAKLSLVVAILLGTGITVNAEELPTDVSTPSTGNILVR